MIIKPEHQDDLRHAGHINGRILATLRDTLYPGMKTQELDDLARAMILEAGAEPPFLGYPPDGEHPYPVTINVSINEELVHAIPGQRVIQWGDIVTLDCGTSYEGMIVDFAITVPVGEVPKPVKKMIAATEYALDVAVKIARPGRRLGDVSFAIQSVLRQFGLSIPPQFGGHGVGYALHDSPHVSNWGIPGRGPELKMGMALAIEPMGIMGYAGVYVMEDHWTVVTMDGSLCAHTEHTVLITDQGAEILTPVPPSVHQMQAHEYGPIAEPMG